MLPPSRYQPVLLFDRDSADFARGVEVGMIWRRLQRELPPLRAVVHAENTEMVLRLAEAHGVHAVAVDLGQDWLDVTFS